MWKLFLILTVLTVASSSSLNAAAQDGDEIIFGVVNGSLQGVYLDGKLAKTCPPGEGLRPHRVICKTSIKANQSCPRFILSVACVPHPVAGSAQGSELPVGKVKVPNRR